MPHWNFRFRVVRIASLSFNFQHYESQSFQFKSFRIIMAICNPNNVNVKINYVRLIVCFQKVSRKGSFTRCDVRLRFSRYRNLIVWLLMTLFTQYDLLFMQCILVCNVAHEWVPYQFCAIAMCDSNVSTLQIASKPNAPCEQFHKKACIKLLSHAEQIALCERTLKGSARVDKGNRKWVFEPNAT